MTFSNTKSAKLSFLDLSGFDAGSADLSSPDGSVSNDANGLEVWQESSFCYTGYLLTNAAFFLCKTSAGDCIPSYRSFSTNCAYP